MTTNIITKDNRQGSRVTGGNPGELEQIARRYVGEHGGESLGEIDTPSFVRRYCNVTLMPPTNLSRKTRTVEPDKKITALLSVLRGIDLSPADKEQRQPTAPPAAVPAFGV